MIEYPRDFIAKLRSVYALDNNIMSLIFCNDEESFKELGKLLKAGSCNNTIHNIDVINAYRSGNMESLYKTACDNAIKEELYSDWIILYSKLLSNQCNFAGQKLIKKIGSMSNSVGKSKN